MNIDCKACSEKMLQMTYNLYSYLLPRYLNLYFEICEKLKSDKNILNEILEFVIAIIITILVVSFATPMSTFEQIILCVTYFMILSKNLVEEDTTTYVSAQV